MAAVTYPSVELEQYIYVRLDLESGLSQLTIEAAQKLYHALEQALFEAGQA